MMGYFRLGKGLRVTHRVKAHRRINRIKATVKKLRSTQLRILPRPGKSQATKKNHIDNMFDIKGFVKRPLYFCVSTDTTNTYY